MNKYDKNDNIEMKFSCYNFNYITIEYETDDDESELTNTFEIKLKECSHLLSGWSICKKIQSK